MKLYTKLTIISVALLSLLFVGSEIKASETTGRLTTGISGNNGNVVDGVVIHFPIANPPAGSYTSSQSITLTASGSTSIRYTLNTASPSVSPTCSTGTLYSGSITIDQSLELQAISCYPENNHSTVASYLYAINMPQPAPAAPASSGGTSSGSSGGGGSPAPIVKADANNDGKTDIIDFVALMANWGKTGSGNIADFDKDNIVGIMDFVALMTYWTK